MKYTILLWELLNLLTEGVALVAFKNGLLKYNICNFIPIIVT